MKCGYCGKSKVIEIDHEVICKTCGIVLQNIENSLGNDEFTNDINDRRTGAPTSLTMHDRGLSTVINSVNKDVTGKPLSNANRAMVQRLRTWDSRSQANEAQVRSLREAMHVLNNIIDKLSLPDTLAEKAAYIYRKAIERKLVKGRSIHGLVAACIYAACRDTETPRTLDDIANGINIRRKDVARCYRLVFRELDLKIPVVDPVKGVSRIASIAGLGEKTKRKAINLLNKAKKLGIVAGKDPMGIAAAALYLSCISSGGNKTQKEISIASGVTEVTIRNRCAGLKKLL